MEFELGRAAEPLADPGGVIVTGSSGEKIVFEGKSKGEFTSPTGRC